MCESPTIAGMVSWVCRRLFRIAAAMLFLAATSQVGSAAGAVPADLSQYRSGPVRVTADESELRADWNDEAGEGWRAVFSLDPEEPLIREIAVEGETVLKEARPLYVGESGKRRKG